MSISSSSSRRDFAKKLSAGMAAGMAAGGFFASTPAIGADKKSLGFALVGLGSLSTHQLGPALAKTQHCHLAGIVTGTPEKERIWSKQYGIDDRHIYNYQNFDKIIDDDAIDVVYVVLPIACTKSLRFVQPKPENTSSAKSRWLIRLTNAVG